MAKNSVITKSFIKRVQGFEGYRVRPYLDTTGHLTVGYGRNLKDNPLSLAEVKYLYEAILQTREGDKNAIHEFHRILLLRDLITAENNISSKCPVYNKIPDSETRQVLVDMTYNMGVDSVLKFSKMLEALENRDYDEAALQILNSQYASETKTRAVKNAFVVADSYMRVISMLANRYPEKSRELSRYL